MGNHETSIESLIGGEPADWRNEGQLAWRMLPTPRLVSVAARAFRLEGVFNCATNFRDDRLSWPTLWRCRFDQAPSYRLELARQRSQWPDRRLGRIGWQIRAGIDQELCDLTGSDQAVNRTSRESERLATPALKISMGSSVEPAGSDFLESFGDL